MTADAARRLSRLLLQIFYRRIEVVGRDGVPASGPVIFVLNHPNGLVDPLFILAFGPSPVSFLAKEPLFRTPVIGHAVKAFGCLPVYRREDGADPRRNARTMMAARDLLARGGSLALFPEGVSHAAPQLAPMKTGAARIALSARALMHAQDPRAGAVQLVPVGLHYPSRGTFRSDAAVVFGAALEVPVVAVDDAAEPPRDAVRALTARIEAGLRAVTVNARDPEHVTLAAVAARLLDDAGDAFPATSAQGPVQRQLSLMRLILARGHRVRAAAPDALDRLVQRLRAYQALAAPDGGRVPLDLPAGRALRHLAKTVLGMAALAPLIGVGLLENYVPYRAVGVLAARAARSQDDVVSTMKVLAGLMLFPVTWLAASAAVGFAMGWTWAALHLLLAPPCAWAALWFAERAADTAGGARVLWRRWLRRREHDELVAERDAVVAELRDAAAHVPAGDM